jgi:transposase
MSARKAAAWFGVGVSSAIGWIARAKIDELAPLPQRPRRPPASTRMKSSSSG